MTQEQLEVIKNDISFRMIEANFEELYYLEQELSWVEELLQEQKDEEEKD